MRRLWWLNLDAERELADPSARATPRRVVQQVHASARAFAPQLCHGDAYVTPPGAVPKLDAVDQLVIWCPTPGALSDLRQAGVRPPRAPALPVLQRVNDRQFAWELSQGPALEGLRRELQGVFPASVPFAAARAFVGAGDCEELSLGDPARLKRRFGFAGKGQRTVPAWPLAEPDAETQRWLQGADRGGGFLVEPEVEIELETSLHGLVTEQELIVGAPCLQECDAYGAPVRIERADPASLPDLVRRCLHEAVDEVARRLRSAGYFGPFGVDNRVFRWRGERGVQLVADLNARFTMGWSIGLGSERERALELLQERTRPDRAHS